MREYRNHKRRAFTLVEIMFAVAIIGIVIFAGLLLMSMSLRNIRANRELAYVARDLETTVENVRNLSWVELTAQPSTQTFDVTKPLIPLFGKPVNPLASTARIFQSTMKNPVGTIAIDAVSGLPTLRKVTVTIERDSTAGAGRIQSSIVTYVAQNGVDRK